ncbi:hypothetical protein JDV02_001809 [Purpureocillium takamizusanense]|uniref:Uncharacterized protein n=1 Tax=Purpureocillium takamizusanense TaxID=2060973 RepID=A0A9Q8Q803_9HYPO|nr:uncharacterized protein JDV02_001809 [Purpureocillium takamizusanense]UNI15263.1 hypothetical protein JDV02_001809 [Purpureocillium takamizusanense]
MNLNDERALEGAMQTPRSLLISTRAFGIQTTSANVEYLPAPRSICGSHPAALCTLHKLFNIECLQCSGLPGSEKRGTTSGGMLSYGALQTSPSSAEEAGLVRWRSLSSNVRARALPCRSQVVLSLAGSNPGQRATHFIRDGVLVGEESSRVFSCLLLVAPTIRDQPWGNKVPFHRGLLPPLIRGKRTQTSSPMADDGAERTSDRAIQQASGQAKNKGASRPKTGKEQGSRARDLLISNTLHAAPADALRCSCPSCPVASHRATVPQACFGDGPPVAGTAYLHTPDTRVRTAGCGAARPQAGRQMIRNI